MIRAGCVGVPGQVAREDLEGVDVVIPKQQLRVLLLFLARKGKTPEDMWKEMGLQGRQQGSRKS